MIPNEVWIKQKERLLNVKLQIGLKVRYEKRYTMLTLIKRSQSKEDCQGQIV